MDPRERFDDAEEALRVALDGHQSDLWTALPGIIQSFNPAAMTATVRPAIQARASALDGSASNVALPLLLDCPVVFPTGGGYTLTFPVRAGDECLVVFGARCIDAWWQSGGVQPQAELRMHDLSDGFALVGPRSQPRTLAGISASTTQLRSDDGRTYVEVDGSGQIVTLSAPFKVRIAAPVLEVSGVINVLNQQGAAAAGTISGALNATGNVVAGAGGGDQVGLQTHQHPDPQGGSSGAPVAGT